MKCNQVAELVGEKWEKTYEQSRRVYGDGLSPTVHTSQGGGKNLKCKTKRTR